MNHKESAKKLSQHIRGAFDGGDDPRGVEEIVVALFPSTDLTRLLIDIASTMWAFYAKACHVYRDVEEFGAFKDGTFVIIEFLQLLMADERLCKILKENRHTVRFLYHGNFEIAPSWEDSRFLETMLHWNVNFGVPALRVDITEIKNKQVSRDTLTVECAAELIVYLDLRLTKLFDN